MNYKIREYKNQDKAMILKIFNYYVENSYAAYPEEKVGMNYLDSLFESADGYPFLVAEDENNEILGFGLLHKFHRADAFNRTAEITYFINPDHQRKGIGEFFLTSLIEKAKELEISNILASISSRNKSSISFHDKHGFEECGRFKKVGQKFDKSFDIIWMQLFL